MHLWVQVASIRCDISKPSQAVQIPWVKTEFTSEILSQLDLSLRDLKARIGAISPTPISPTLEKHAYIV